MTAAGALDGESAPGPPAIDVRNLSRRFGATTVLDDVSFQVAAGECLAIVGPNGAGKSTLFDLISGRQAPSQGQVLLHGTRIDGRRPHQIHRLGLSRSFQASQLFAGLSVQDHLRCSVMARLGIGYRLWQRLAANAEVDRLTGVWAERLGLHAQRDVPARQLAYADQRALELGMALAGGAGTVLLDEPTAGMGGSESQRFVALIRQVTAGRTVLVVEHDMAVVFGLAHRIAVLAEGRLIACGSPAEVRADARVRSLYQGIDLGGDLGSAEYAAC